MLSRVLRCSSLRARNRRQARDLASSIHTHTQRLAFHLTCGKSSNSSEISIFKLEANRSSRATVVLTDAFSTFATYPTEQPAISESASCDSRGEIFSLAVCSRAATRCLYGGFSVSPTINASLNWPIVSTEITRLPLSIWLTKDL